MSKDMTSVLVDKNNKLIKKVRPLQWRSYDVTRERAIRAGDRTKQSRRVFKEIFSSWSR